MLRAHFAELGKTYVVYMIYEVMTFLWLGMRVYDKLEGKQDTKLLF